MSREKGSARAEIVGEGLFVRLGSSRILRLDGPTPQHLNPTAEEFPSFQGALDAPLMTVG